MFPWKRMCAGLGGSVEGIVLFPCTRSAVEKPPTDPSVIVFKVVMVSGWRNQRWGKEQQEIEAFEV